VRFRARWIKYWKRGEYTGIVDSRGKIIAIEQPQRWCSVVYDNRDSLENTRDYFNVQAWLCFEISCRTSDGSSPKRPCVSRGGGSGDV
jgi:hypothetical protein